MSNTKLSQLHVLRHDKWLIACLTVIPLLLTLMIWWIFSQSIVRDLPFGVVAESDSRLSRMLVRELDATSTLSVDYSFQSKEQAKEALRRNEIYGYAVIPYRFEKDIYLGKQPDISVFYNSQYILVGRLISSAVSSTIGTFNAQVGAVSNLSSGNRTMQSALARSVTIRNQITPLFNRNTNYSQFLVGAIIPAIWQIMMVVSAVLILAANHRVYGLKGMLSAGTVRSMLSIGSFYLPLFMLQGAGFLFLFYHVLGWPMHGSYQALLFAQLVTVFACLVMGAFFYLLTLDAARAMSFAGAFTAPSFAFMGVTFPVSDMGALAQWWRSLLPVSHYIEAQIAQSSYGVTNWSTIESLSPVLYYFIPFLLLPVLAKKHLAKQEA
ncbi:ABC transporter permease [Vibrio sp. JC009]|uniref:ABC transporter permease n=1 Tax=Vibrio sp. JC009 TaxID=2912314 RepID=UPI0023B0FCB6|nr:ABC transporter permease [Vibrio sp. JC009]WED23212.1 ABC transporter permease [Vibrio sp. JC009]